MNVFSALNIAPDQGRISVGPAPARPRTSEMETLRLCELETYRAGALQASDRFERLVRLTARVLDAPFAALILVTRDSSEFVGRYRLPVRKIAATASFARQCIAGTSVLTVSDATEDARFRKNPLVCDAPFVKAYAGAPLTNANGWNLGVIAVYDTAPREFTSRECRLLHDLGAQAVDALELNRALHAAHCNEIALKAKEARFRATFETRAVGMAIMDGDGVWQQTNGRLSEMLAIDSEPLVDLSVSDFATCADASENDRLFAQLSEGRIGHYSFELPLTRRDGRSTWVRHTVGRSHGIDSRTQPYIAMFEDISERREAEAARNLLIGELSHRVKNTLAIVQGIARQSIRAASSVSDFAETFEPRLRALAQSHAMLSRSNWSDLDARELVDALVGETFSAYGGRVTVEGAGARLSAQTAVTLSLVLHELFTNAVKHGALANDTGTISLALSVTRSKEQQPRELRIDWREHGGPMTDTPRVTGFGTQLLKDGIERGLGGRTELQFAKDGLTATLHVPLDQSDA